MITVILSNKRLNSTVTELFIRGRKSHNFFFNISKYVS